MVQHEQAHDPEAARTIARASSIGDTVGLDPEAQLAKEIEHTRALLREPAGSGGPGRER